MGTALYVKVIFIYISSLWEVNKNNLPEKTDNIDIYNVIINEMNNKALDIFPNVDKCIFAAAVCDYQPKKISKKYRHLKKIYP